MAVWYMWYIISDYVLMMKACPTVGCVVYNEGKCPTVYVLMMKACVVYNKLCPRDEVMLNCVGCPRDEGMWYIISDYVLVMKACPTVGCVVYNK